MAFLTLGKLTPFSLALDIRFALIAGDSVVCLLGANESSVPFPHPVASGDLGLTIVEGKDGTNTFGDLYPLGLTIINEKDGPNTFGDLYHLDLALDIRFALLPRDSVVWLLGANKSSVPPNPIALGNLGSNNLLDLNLCSYNPNIP